MTLALLTATAATALGQPYFFTTGFEEYNPGDEVMFRQPRFSGSTDGIWIGQTGDGIPWDDAQVVPNSGEWCLPEPDGCLSDPAYEIFFAWRDPTDVTTAGVRCTTSGAAHLNRPSIDLDGKIRFKMAVTAFTFEGDVTPNAPFGFQYTDGSPKILMCLAIVETGRDLPLGAPDTGAGDLEYLYLPASEVVPVADSNGMIEWPPGGKRFSATTELWPPSDAAFVNVEIDLSQVTAAQLRGFANNSDGVPTAGDGMLDATINPSGHGVNRGALESIIFTNDPTDPTAEYFYIYIDDLQFESNKSNPTPPPTITSPILRNATTVTVTDISASATQFTLHVDNGTDPDQVINTTGVTSWQFTLPHPAIAGDVYTATQVVDGLQSSNSTPVPVTFPGPTIGLLPKDGDTTVRIVGVDPLASSVELFVNGVSRGSTAFPGGTEITVPAGASLVMGEEVTATQFVSGADSDPSAVATVTTNGVQVIFCDDFEYADQAAFDAVWTAHAGDTQLTLSNNVYGNATPGGSKSAYNPAGGSGVNAYQSQLINAFGPVTGTETHPIIFNVSYRDGLVNESLYRQSAELRPAIDALPLIAMGDTNEVSGNYFFARATGGPGWVLLNGFGQPQRTNGWHVLTAVIRTSRIDFYVDGKLARNDIANSASVAFTQALIGQGLSTVGGDAYYDDLCVEVGALNFNTITPQPPAAPTVVSPIIPGAMTVTVNNIDTNATAVTLHLNGSDTPLVPAVNPAGATSVVINLAAPAASNNYYTAKQTVNGLTSAHSAQVYVLLPAPTLYKASAAGETSVRVLDVDTNASVVQVLVDGVVRGTLNNPNASDVTVPITGGALVMGQSVTARMTVNGVQSVESVQDTVTTNTTGTVIWCDNFDSYANQAAFEAVYTPITSQMQLSTVRNATPGGAKSMFAPIQNPSTRSQGPLQTSVQATDTNPIVWNINIFDDTAGTGVNQYADLNNLQGTTTLTEIGIASPTFTGSGQPETHYQARLVGSGAPAGTNNGWFHLNKFGAPTRSIGWHTFTVVFKGPAPGQTTGHQLDFYVDGKLAEKNRTLTADTLRNQARIGSGQNTTAAAYFDDYCAVVGPLTFPTLAPQPPLKPTIVPPVQAGATTVTLSGIGANATSATVFANGSPIGTFTDNAGTNGTITVTVSPLVHLNAITATQTNANGTSPLSDALEVGKGNGDVLICIGIRESGDTNPLGTQSVATGNIEFVGSAPLVSSAPQGEPVSPSGGWITLEFDPVNDPKQAFPGLGDGVITATRGYLENLAVTVNTASPNRSTGVYTLYVDNVVNVGAGPGGSDFVIEDFESNAPGEEVLFQEPNLSGTTASFLAVPPNVSEVSAAQASEGLQSARLQWFWKATTVGRWLRLTTSGATFRSRPIIDLTKPIRMDILLAPSCQTVAGDADGDGDVDLADVNEIVACLDGPLAGFGAGCECADLNGDLDIDLADYAVLQGLLAP